MKHRVTFVARRADAAAPREIGSVRVATGSTLAAAVCAAGLPLAAGCSLGGLCGSCAVRVAGAGVAPETVREHRVKARNRVGEGLRLACFVAIRGDLEVSADYW